MVPKQRILRTENARCSLARSWHRDKVEEFRKPRPDDLDILLLSSISPNHLFSGTERHAYHLIASLSTTMEGTGKLCATRIALCQSLCGANLSSIDDAVRLQACCAKQCTIGANCNIDSGLLNPVTAVLSRLTFAAGGAAICSVQSIACKLRQSGASVIPRVNQSPKLVVGWELG